MSTEPLGTEPLGHEPADSELPVVTPGRRSLWPWVARFDREIDERLEHLRGRPVPDAIFTTASHLGDFSVVGHLANVTRGLTSPRRARQIPVLAAALGAESLLVNQGIKRLFRRPRPTIAGDPRLPVRQPSTSSFPSGHASAAGFAATLLTSWDGARSAPLWWSVGGVVASSRVYVRIHHASDVVAGVALGAGLGLVARRILR